MLGTFAHIVFVELLNGGYSGVYELEYEQIMHIWSFKRLVFSSPGLFLEISPPFSSEDGSQKL